MLAGIKEPWKSSQISVIASGDDTVAWVQPRWADRLRDSILTNTLRTGSEEVENCLGQVVKEVKVGEFWDVDFCSKKSLAPDGSFSSWVMHRDLRKVLTTK